MDGGSDQVDHEVHVVAFADAGADPRTVVVEALDAVITDGAVSGFGGSVDLAGVTDFDVGDFPGQRKVEGSDFMLGCPGKGAAGLAGQTSEGPGGVELISRRGAG